MLGGIYDGPDAMENIIHGLLYKAAFRFGRFNQEIRRREGTNTGIDVLTYFNESEVAFA
jgi:hypothetical protein